MIKSVIESFFVAIYQGKLIVKVGSITVNDTSLAKLLEKYYAEPDGRFYADEYYRVLTSKDATVHTEPNFLDYGEIELRILENKDFKKRVAMFRRSGMKIYDRGHFRTPLRFAGVFSVKGEKLDGLLRSMEPPSHDAWEPERASDPAEGRRVLNALQYWIRDCVRELAGVEVAAELDAEGVSQFLPDDGEDSDKGSPQNPEESGSEPAAKLDMRIRSTPPTTAPAPVDNTSDPEADGDESGGSDGTGNGGGGDGSNNGDGGSGGSGGGTGSTGGAEPSKRVELAKLRIYCSDPSKGAYRLFFQPQSQDAAHLRVFIIGEVGTEPASVLTYSLNGEPAVGGSQKGLIGPIVAPNGKRATLDVILDSPLRCALGVTAYAD